MRHNVPTLTGSLPYGIRHRPGIESNDSTHAFRWMLAVLVILITISFLSVRGCLKSKSDKVFRNEKTDKGLATNVVSATMATAETKPVFTGNPVSPSALPPPKFAPTATPEARKVEKWLETADSRPVEERTLLERLAEAERRRNDAIALDSVKRLMASTAMADLHDTLAVRLGELNMKLLLSGANNPWTTVRTIRTGDNITRIAREHRTTTSSIFWLNGLKEAEYLQVGQKLRILDFPDATLIVHVEPCFADLFLKGKIFKRYFLLSKPTAATGSYPITRNIDPQKRFTTLGLKFAKGEADEVALFMALASAVIVTTR